METMWQKQGSTAWLQLLRLTQDCEL